MTPEIWTLLVMTSTAVGCGALLVRCALGMHQWLQTRKLARDNQELQRWWAVVTQVPGDVLTPELRKIIGQVMERRLASARQLHPKHPFLHSQHGEIARFVTQRPLRPTRSGGRARREQTVASLRALRRLLHESGHDASMPRQELAAAEAAVARRLTEMEFLQDQQTTLRPETLRRMTRALGSVNALETGQAR